MTAKTRLVDAVKAVVDPVTGGISLSSGGDEVLTPSLDTLGVPRHEEMLNGVCAKMRMLQGAAADERHLAELEIALRPLLRSTAWPKIRELWVPTGTNLAAALVKIKSTYNAVANESLLGVNFVDADYVPTIGLIGDGTTKYLYSQTTPANAQRTAGDASGCTSRAYGFAVYPTSPVHSTSGMPLSNRDASNYRSLGAQGSSGGGDAIGTGAINREVSAGTATGHRARMQFIQNRGGYALAGTGSLTEAYVAATETAAGNTKVFLFAANNGSNSPSANSYYNGVLSGYALFDSLTDAELLKLSNFFDDINYALKRIGNDLVFFGDSNAANTSVLIYNRWAFRVAQDLGYVRMLSSATRARTSDVATVTFASAHGLRTGDTAQAYLFGGSNYNSDSGMAAEPTLPCVHITVVDATTISYPSIGSNEVQTADTTGRIVTGYKNVAVNGSTVSYCATVGNGGAANTYNRWTWPVWTTGGAPLPRNAFLYRAFQFPASIYIFNIGANDCSFSGDIAAFEAAYRATMDQLVAAGISMKRLLLNSLLYGNYMYIPPVTTYRTNSLAEAYNAVIAEIARDYGCKYVNLYSLWNSSNYATYLVDESAGNGGYTNYIHPNEAGNALIYSAIMTAIAGM